MKKRQVLSIFIDGTLMRLALMSQDEAVPIVQALETTKLVEPFDVPGPHGRFRRESSCGDTGT